MKTELRYALKDLPKIAKTLKNQLKNHAVISFAGPLGAGKTTLIKELLKQVGIAEPITSPTFTYLNQYENERGERFYHFDLFRMKDASQFQEVGFDEYLYQPRSWAIIEWPEVIEPLIAKGHCAVAIEYDADPNMRRITISGVPKGGH